MSKKLTILIVAGAFSLSAMLMLSNIARAESAGSLNNAPPNGKPDMSKQPDKEVVKQPATSSDKKMPDSQSTTPK